MTGDARRAFLGLGANLGDRRANMREALRRLAVRCRIVAVSPLYETPALVPEGEPPGPDFLNAACEIETALSPHELLAFVQEVERALGRGPHARWAARPIDIDILLCGDRHGGEVIDTPELVVPHPQMTARNFVLVPLADIARDVVHPAAGRSIGDLAAAVTRDDLRRVEGSEWADAPR
jgi:2-amino-4-hydroxy-6-hydroxymethyldihydropteridine diphosphokinase